MAFIITYNHKPLFVSHPRRCLCKKSPYNNNTITHLHPTASLQTPSRRAFLQLLSLLPVLPLVPKKTSALPGLQSFPLTLPLSNQYYFLRAAQSLSDARGVVVTNPVWKLSLDLHGLTRHGQREAKTAAARLNKMGVGQDAWVWSGTQTSSLETAEVVASTLGIGREQLIPEYAFLDSRGVGAMEWGPCEEVDRAVGQVDQQGDRQRLELGVDGTPGESVHDVFVRMRQLISKIETAWNGQDVVIVAPDSYTLAIMEAAMKGRDITGYRDCMYRTGEVRKIDPVVRVVEPKKSLTLAEALTQFKSERSDASGQENL